MAVRDTNFGPAQAAATATGSGETFWAGAGGRNRNRNYLRGHISGRLGPRQASATATATSSGDTCRAGAGGHNRNSNQLGGHISGRLGPRQAGAAATATAEPGHAAGNHPVHVAAFDSNENYAYAASLRPLGRPRRTESPSVDCNFDNTYKP